MLPFWVHVSLLYTHVTCYTSSLSSMLPVPATPSGCVTLLPIIESTASNSPVCPPHYMFFQRWSPMSHISSNTTPTKKKKNANTYTYLCVSRRIYRIPAMIWPIHVLKPILAIFWSFSYTAIYLVPLGTLEKYVYYQEIINLIHLFYLHNLLFKK